MMPPRRWPPQAAEESGPHGGALHAERRERRRTGPARARAATSRSRRRSSRCRISRIEIVVLSNLWNAGHQGRRRALRQGSRDPHLHHHQEDARRRSRQRRFDGSGGRAEGRRADAAAVARTGRHAGRDRRRCRVGYTRVYGSHIAWSRPTTPLAREINPRSVYERLFRAAAGPQGNAAKMDTLLLDRVLGDAKRLRAEVGAADRLRLDEYLSVMRSLEERVQRVQQRRRKAPGSRASASIRRLRPPSSPATTPSTSA